MSQTYQDTTNQSNSNWNTFSVLVLQTNKIKINKTQFHYITTKISTYCTRVLLSDQSGLHINQIFEDS